MSQFGCWVYLIVRAKDGQVEFEKYVELPFAPFPGLEIHFDEDDDVTIHAVEYSVKDECFWCRANYNIGEDCSCGPEDDCCVLCPKDGGLFSDYAENGWERRDEIDWLHEKPYYRCRDWQFTEEQLTPPSPPAPQSV